MVTTNNSLKKSSESGEIYGDLEKPVKALQHSVDIEMGSASGTAPKKINI
jgi:hypothetical protein